MRKASLLVALVWIVILTGCTGDGQKQELSFADTFGVWANKDCELVSTGKYSLLFERIGDSIWASFQLNELRGDTIAFDTRAIVILDSTSRKFMLKAKDLLKGEELLADYDSSNVLSLGKKVCVIRKGKAGPIFESKGEMIWELARVPERLRLLTPAGRWQELSRIERIEVTQPYECAFGSKDNIGYCLQEWELGSEIQKYGDGYNAGILINTNRHAYVFSIAGMIYCRAARIRSDNCGTVFAQNIRLMYNVNEFTAAMDADNIQMASREIIIQDSLFDPTICIYSADAIYWSVKSYSDSLIILNGCGGEDYLIERAVADSGERLEWFKYEVY